MNEKIKKFLTKESIISAGIGLVLGIGITCLIGILIGATGMAKLRYGSDAIASVDGKEITTQEIYEKAKKIDGLSLLINRVDKKILQDMYQLTEKEEKEVTDQADYYIQYYEASGVPKDQFLLANGFDSYEDFLEDIRISLKTNKYLYDYLEKQLEPGAVQKYYDENKDSIETYDSEHILVRIANDVTDEQALALANEIIEKLNSGKSFEEVVEEYGDRIVHEELGYQGKTASLEQPYIDELVALQDGEYSKTPIKTSYGYHIVHRLSTSTMEELRPTIIETLSEDLISSDENFKYKALIELRKEKNLKIYDETINKLYEDYCDSIYNTEE